jgi:chemotaxis protein MotB
MAFFVVMYSMAGANKTPDTAAEQAVLKSLHERFGPNWLGLTGLWPGPDKGGFGPRDDTDSGAGSRRNHPSARKVRGRPTAGERSRADARRPGKLAPIGGVLVFPEDSASLTAGHEKQIQRAVDEIAGKPQRIEIRGHTTRKPSQEHGDNWNLAYARCRATMDRLVAAGIEARRIRLGVAADNEPLDGGHDAIARSQSARVEIFMLDEFVGDLAETKAFKSNRQPSQ